MLEIERTAHRVPWSEKILKESFGTGYRAVGLFVEGVLQGYMIVHDVLGELTLMNIAVHPQEQGKGYGRVLLEELFRWASDENGHKKAQIFLEVREGNHAAKRLYERLGFTQIALRKGYYPPFAPGGARVDALVYKAGGRSWD